MHPTLNPPPQSPPQIEFEFGCRDSNSEQDDPNEFCFRALATCRKHDTHCLPWDKKKKQMLVVFSSMMNGGGTVTQIGPAKENSHTQPLTTQQPPQKALTAFTMTQIGPAKENSHTQPFSSCCTDHAAVPPTSKFQFLICLYL